MKTIKQVEKNQVEKIGWRVNEWATAVGISRASIYELMTSKIIASVRFGTARIITTNPRDFLVSLEERGIRQSENSRVNEVSEITRGLKAIAQESLRNPTRRAK